jgi:hypothetical protein
MLIITCPSTFSNSPDEAYSGNRMLVVCHEKFKSAMKPFVLHKNEMGLKTEMMVIRKMDFDSLQGMVREYIGNHDDTKFLLLVGDIDYVPYRYFIGKQVTGATDHTFAPEGTAGDYITGRFSCETVEEAEAMVTRSILYDHMRAEQSWSKNALIIASNNIYSDPMGEKVGLDIPDYEFALKLEEILKPVGLSTIVLVDKDTINLMDNKEVISTINNGCSFINYTGHGDPESWVTSNFSREDAWNLKNANKWPFIFSTACQVGNYIDTCLAEAFLRAKDSDGYPTGAIACYASSADQSLGFPMYAQQSFNKFWVEGKYFTFGELCENAALSMYEVDPAANYTHTTWNIFGDPSAIIFPYNGQITPYELTVSTRIKGGEYDFNATEQIVATNKISNNADVEYHANSVKLKDGFKFSGKHLVVSPQKYYSVPGNNMWHSILSNDQPNELTDLSHNASEMDKEPQLFPIPSNGLITADFGNLEGEKTVVITDMNGKVVYQNRFDEQKSDIDLSALQSGVYTTRIMTSQMSVIKSIILK